MSQKDGDTNPPQPGQPREVIGLFESPGAVDSQAEDIFREDGYEVDPSARLIKEGVLPDAKAHLYVQVALLALLGLAQPITFLLNRTRKRE